MAPVKDSNSIHLFFLKTYKMKNHEILSKFSEYCAALNLTQGRSLFLPDGKYELAVPGTVFLSQAPGRMYSIMRNGDGGTVSPVYGHTTGDKVYGYMEGVIASIPTIETIKTMGNIIRALDEDGKYCDYWLNDGDYVPAIEDSATSARHYVAKKVPEDQIYSAIHAAEGRISAGAEIDQAFDWLREEISSSLKGEIIYPD